MLDSGVGVARKVPACRVRRNWREFIGKETREMCSGRMGRYICEWVEFENGDRCITVFLIENQGEQEERHLRLREEWEKKSSHRKFVNICTKTLLGFMGTSLVSVKEIVLEVSWNLQNHNT